MCERNAKRRADSQPFYVETTHTDPCFKILETNYIDNILGKKKDVLWLAYEIRLYSFLLSAIPLAS